MNKIMERLYEDMLIKNWYTKTFPQDELGQRINPDVTFEDLFVALDNYQNVYKILGVGDSVVRERCFHELSKRTGNSYDTIYNQWLLCHLD